MNTPRKPSLETMAGLYRAACELTDEPNLALERVREAMARHGYTEEQVRRATPEAVTRNTTG